MPSKKEKKIPQMKCKMCHGKWTPRVGAPKKCPACQSRNWDGAVIYKRTAMAARRAKKIR